jgi:hypothetical protein
MGISMARRVDALKQRKSELDSFKAISIPKSEINVGIGGVVGHEIAMAVQTVLRAWHFPGDPSPRTGHCTSISRPHPYRKRRGSSLCYPPTFYPWKYLQFLPAPFVRKLMSWRK